MQYTYLPLTLCASIAARINHAIEMHRFRKQLDAKLAARKVLRPYHQDAAKRGWQTRKAR